MLLINKLVNQKSLFFFSSQCLLISKLQNLPLFTFDLDVKPKMYIKEQGVFFPLIYFAFRPYLETLEKAG